MELMRLFLFTQLYGLNQNPAQLFRIPLNFSESRSTFQNPAQLFRIPLNFAESRSTFKNPAQLFRIPLNHSQSRSTCHNPEQLIRNLFTFPLFHPSFLIYDPYNTRHFSVTA